LLKVIVVNIIVNKMNHNLAVAGSIPTINIIDYLQPNINRPDLYFQASYPLQGGGGGGATKSIMKSAGIGSTQSIQRTNSLGNERSPIISLLYTIGLIILSASIFLTLGAWSNTLLSWYDSIFVNEVVYPVTKSRFYFAITLTFISFVIIITLVGAWYYFALYQGI
jgi:hypothetical protein